MTDEIRNVSAQHSGIPVKSLRYSDIKEGMISNTSLDEIKHHGIKGQKWGWRRFQYTNGRLTPEGQARYRKQTKGSTRVNIYESEKTPLDKKTIKRIENKLNSNAKIQKFINKNKSGKYIQVSPSNYGMAFIGRYSGFSPRAIGSSLTGLPGRLLGLQGPNVHPKELGGKKGTLRYSDIKEGLISNSSLSDTPLSHHGILGQKKGNRRFQYPDGSLTPEGRRHYGVGPARDDSSTKKSLLGKAESTAKKLASKAGSKIKEVHDDREGIRLAKMAKGRGYRRMGDKNLNKVVERLKLEKQYRDLRRDEPGGKAKTLVWDIFKDTLKQSIPAAFKGKAVLAATGKNKDQKGNGKDKTDKDKTDKDKKTKKDKGKDKNTNTSSENSNINKIYNETWNSSSSSPNGKSFIDDYYSATINMFERRNNSNK